MRRPGRRRGCFRRPRTSPAAIPLVPLGRASLAIYPHFVAAIEEASEIRTGYRTGGALEVLCHGDAERELSTLVALHHGLGLACEPLRLEEAREMEPALGRDARAAAFLPHEASVDPALADLSARCCLKSGWRGATAGTWRLFRLSGTRSDAQG